MSKIDELIQAVRKEVPQALIEKNIVSMAAQSSDFEHHHDGVHVFLPEPVYSREQALNLFLKIIRDFGELNFSEFRMSLTMEWEYDLEFGFHDPEWSKNTLEEVEPE